MKGRYFDGTTSAAYPVEVVLRDDATLALLGDGFERIERLARVRISERIGNTQRRIHFQDGATCELDDNDAIDAWLALHREVSFEHRVFRLERAWPIAIVALVLTGVVTWLAIQFGVPALAARATDVVPVSVDRRLGQDSLAILDRAFFAPSDLASERQREIRSDFERIVAHTQSGHDYRLEFRKGGVVGANAFALPSGIVVITDELVELAEHQNEIIAVLAHEVGHVVHRHSLRSILQSSATAAIMAGLFGDLTSLSSLIAATPAVLVQAKFSRGLETEADDFSYEWLRAQNIPAHHFGDLLKRMEAKHGDGDDFSYLSSHPSAKERARE